MISSLDLPGGRHERMDVLVYPKRNIICPPLVPELLEKTGEKVNLSYLSCSNDWMFAVKKSTEN